MTAKLWYWPSIPGRGEFVRLSLEAASIPYLDCARTKGEDALMADMANHATRPFAPPYLLIDGLTIGQTATILAYLGEKRGLACDTVKGRVFAQTLQLTIADAVAEAHNVHHPVAMSLYYEDQKDEAAAAAKGFREERIPKFLGYFEDVLGRSDTGWLTDTRWRYPDLSLFQLVEGLRYAFPRRMQTIEPDHPRVAALTKAVAELPELADYLASERRIPFNEDGIFRHYPELDSD